MSERPVNEWMLKKLARMAPGRGWIEQNVWKERVKQPDARGYVRGEDNVVREVACWRNYHTRKNWFLAIRMEVARQDMQVPWDGGKGDGEENE